MKTWVAISHSKKANTDFPTDSNVSVKFLEKTRDFLTSASDFYWYLPAMPICLPVHSCTGLTYLNQTLSFPACPSLSTNGPSVLSWRIPPASHSRTGHKSCGKTLTQIYPGSRQAQEQQKVNAGRVWRTRVDLPAPQWRGRWASGYLSSVSWAAGHPETLGRCRGALCPMRSKSISLGCIGLLLIAVAILSNPVWDALKHAFGPEGAVRVVCTGCNRTGRALEGAGWVHGHGRLVKMGRESWRFPLTPGTKVSICTSQPEEFKWGI